MLKPKKYLIAILALALAPLLASCASTSVDAADKTVRTGWGGKIKGIEGPGFHPHMVGNNTGYSCGTQQTIMSRDPNDGDIKGDDSVSTASKEGAVIAYDVTISYHLRCLNEDLKSLYLQRIRTEKDIREKIVRPAVRSVLRDVVPKFSALAAATSARAETESLLRTGLEKVFERKPSVGAVIIDAIALRAIYLPENLQAQVNLAIAEQAKATKVLLSRQTAEAQADTARIVAEKNAAAQKATANGDAAKRVIEAQAAADVQKIAASAQASATKIQADAQAEANRAEAQSLTPDLIELRKSIAQSQALGKAGTVIVGGGSSGSGQIILDARK
jgi:regulator of protease activity HflC (stomatin/prohibitin superfamily)